MEPLLLTKGYAHNDVLLWFFVIALLVVLIGGRWLIHRLAGYVKHVVQNCWPLC